MHLVLTGATGLVGSAVLRAMLQDASVSKVTIVSRRAVPQANGHAKAHVLLRDDFSTYNSNDAELAGALASASGAVWALGISQSQVSAKVYEQITYDYALAFAKFWSGLHHPGSGIAETSDDAKNVARTLVFVSGEGATHTPGIFTPRFGSVKGRTEQALLDLTSDQDGKSKFTVWAARPGGVDPRQEKEIHDFIPPTGAGKNGLMVAMNAVVPGMMSPTGPLAKVLVALAKGEYATTTSGHSQGKKEVKVEGGVGKEWRGGVVRNTELRRLGGL